MIKNNLQSIRKYPTLHLITSKQNLNYKNTKNHDVRNSRLRFVFVRLLFCLLRKFPEWKTIVKLKCDPARTKIEDAKLDVIDDTHNPRVSRNNL